MSKIVRAVFEKSPKNLIFDHKKLKKSILGFFFENPAVLLYFIYFFLISCKKAEKSNDGKYDNFWGPTDRQTDQKYRP